jgi:hypothetical protein
MPRRLPSRSRFVRSLWNCRRAAPLRSRSRRRSTARRSPRLEFQSLESRIALSVAPGQDPYLVLDINPSGSSIPEELSSDGVARPSIFFDGNL